MGRSVGVIFLFWVVCSFGEIIINSIRGIPNTIKPGYKQFSSPEADNRRSITYRCCRHIVSILLTLLKHSPLATVLLSSLVYRDQRVNKLLAPQTDSNYPSPSFFFFFSLVFHTDSMVNAQDRRRQSVSSPYVEAMLSEGRQPRHSLISYWPYLRLHLRRRTSWRCFLE